MMKKILIGLLVGVVLTATGVSAYNTTLAKNTEPGVAQTNPVAAGQGYGRQGSNSNASGNPLGNIQPDQTQPGAANGWAQGGDQGNGFNGSGGRGNGRRGGQNGGNNPNPQNGLSDWVTLQGTVTNIALPEFTLVTADGASIIVQLGNPNYLDQIGLTLSEGEAVTLTGAYDANGALAVSSLTNDTTGATYTLRDPNGRPAWAGGKGNH